MYKYLIQVIEEVTEIIHWTNNWIWYAAKETRYNYTVVVVWPLNA